MKEYLNTSTGTEHNTNEKDTPENETKENTH